MCANQRRRVNYISQVADERGNQCTTLDEVGRAFIEYYQHFFSTSGPRGFDKCLAALEVRVTQEMNEQLVKEFTTVEVSWALSQISPLKAP